MRRRNEVLHAEIERVVDLKLQIPSCKTIADRHHTSQETIRTLIKRAKKARKFTLVNIQTKQE
jgi:DNA-binding CsgD family transcriptional regulator